MRRILLLLLMVFFSFSLFKTILLNYYRVDKVEIINDNIFCDEITITQKDIDNLLYREIITNNGKRKLYIRNDFTDYIAKENYYVFSENNYLIVNEDIEYRNLLLSKNLLLEINEDKKFTNEDRLLFLEKERIDDDIDLLYYIKNNYYFKSNIFTSIEDIKRNYMLNSFVSVAIPFFDSITLINGDYKGYIVNNRENIREIHIIIDDYQYIFSLLGDDITSDSYIMDLFSTLRIFNNEDLT